MKYILTIALCSMVENTCIAPYTFPQTFNGLFDCQIAGYNISIEKIEEIGKENINKYGIYTKFSCLPMETT
mgnify:FL=1